jgi:glycosyltransferase involved in cell wall biosynthesis
MADRIGAAGGRLIAFPAGTKNPARIWISGRRIARLMREEDVALIHARSRAPAWSALLAARATGRPFVTTYHGAYAESGPLKRFYNSVMARSDAVIANSHYTAGLIRSRYGTPASRIRVIHRGIDPVRFDPAAIAPARVAELCRRWGVAAGEQVVLQAARLTGWKGQSVLIEAARTLAAAGRLGNAIIVLAGDAQGREDYAEALRRQAREAGIGDRVRLVGHVDDIPAAFLAALVAVIASTEPEAFGRAAAEAEAMACPVIATDIGAPPETVLAEPRVAAVQATGWLVAPGDAAALAECIHTALTLPPAERAAIGRRARAHVLANFTLDAMKRSTLEVYDELLGTRLAAGFGAEVGGETGRR